MNVERIRKEWIDYIDSWAWDYRCDLHWNYALELPKEQAEKRTKQFLNRLRYEMKFKFGALVFIPTNVDGLPHCHILILKDTSEPKNNRMSPELLKSILRNYCTTCKITDVVNNQEAFYLLKEKNLHLYNDDRTEKYFYRPNLLRKLH